MELIIKPELRPAIVTKCERVRDSSTPYNKSLIVPKKIKVLIHPMVNPTKPGYMVCEYQDGTVHEVPISNIRFIDNIFTEYSWSTENE